MPKPTRFALLAFAFSAACLSACGGSSTGSSQAIPVDASSSDRAPTVASSQTAYVIRLTPQHTIVVVNAGSVTASGDNVMVRYTSGATQTLAGQAPTVARTALTYYKSAASPQAGKRRTMCTPSDWRYPHYDQAYSFQEYNAGAGYDYYYDLFWSAPSYDNYVGGTQTFTWTGHYADGSSFSVTDGPETFNPGYSSGVPSGQIDFDGGSTHDAVYDTTVKITYTDIYNNTWDGYGSKTAMRCTL
jgi:hypothetical protein